MDFRPVWGYREKRPVRWFSHRLDQGNQHCLYCGVLVGIGSTVESDKEHVVARNFVPPGSFSGTDFNFIFRACKSCNGRKANAERHVSTISLLTSPARVGDAKINAQALHKATNDFHPARRTRVKDAAETMRIHSDFGALSMNFEFKAPPQMDDHMAGLVACNQVQALFALGASEDPRFAETTHLLPASHWKPLGAFPATDWGNCGLAEVTDRVAHWPILTRFDTAGGYFRFVARQLEPDDSDWFWALEWNRSVRVAGVVSGNDHVRLFENLPQPRRIWLADEFAIREHMAIDLSRDRLFPQLV